MFSSDTDRKGLGQALLGYGLVLSVGGSVLLCFIVGRLNAPSFRPAEARRFYRLIPLAQVPMKVAMPVAGVMAPTAEGEMEEESPARRPAPAPETSLLDSSVPFPQRALALKLASRKQSPVFYETAARALSDPEPETRQVALRLLVEQAPQDVRSREVLSAWLRQGVPDPAHRAMVYEVVGRYGGEREMSGLSAALFQEQDPGLLSLAVKALAANEGAGAQALGVSITLGHPDPGVRRRCEEPTDF